jgi:glycerol-3-phosphate dehydrogenase (NAD(P)+)
MKQIAIIGAGNWGTALAIIAARAGHSVNLWSRNPARNSVSIPANVTATSDLNEALHDASMILFAAPSHTARELLTAISPLLAEATIIVSVSKGIEIETGKRISEIAKEVAGSAYPLFVFPDHRLQKKSLPDIPPRSSLRAKTPLPRAPFRTI